MVQLAQPPDDPIKNLAAQLATTVADAMDGAGVALTLTNTMRLTAALGKALETVGCGRERDERQGRVDRRAAWVCEYGLLGPIDAARHLGLTAQEFETAREMAIIAPVEVPTGLHSTSAHFTAESWRYYLSSTTLADTDRACIAHETLLTRTQAAVRLGMPLATFDQLRLEHGLTAVDAGHDGSGARLTRYRTDAIDGLKAVARAGGMRR